MPDLTPRDVAAVIVLYRPDTQVMEHVATFSAQLPRVFAVDNTEEPDSGFVGRLKEYGNVEYLPMDGNVGIAAALNRGIERAASEGFMWTLTMDQDSTPTDEMVTELVKAANELDEEPPLGLITPTHVREDKKRPKAKPGCTQAFVPWTSGDLLSTAAWEAVGRFDESLFIDEVDHDLCLRMHQHGFAVLRSGSAHLLHRLGAPTTHRFPIRMRVSNHSPMRRYYMTRNVLVVADRYGEEFPKFRDNLIHETRRGWLGVLLYEKQKLAKLTMMWRGYRDYRLGVMGPYSR